MAVVVINFKISKKDIGNAGLVGSDKEGLSNTNSILEHLKHQKNVIIFYYPETGMGIARVRACSSMRMSQCWAN